MPVRLSDRIGVGIAYVAGTILIVAVAVIMLWLIVQGLGTISWDFLTGEPAPGTLEQGVSGGILPAIVGTFLVVAFGMAVAFPLGLGVAIFLTEYRQPAWLAKGTDTAIDLIFGVPSIVFALFGLAIFSQGWLSFISNPVGDTGMATAQSFFCSSLMMALIGLPPVVRSSQAAILGVPDQQREAAYALGKGRLTTIRRIVVPGARPGIATGIVLGVGRIAGDTAIVWILLGGAVLQAPPDGWYLPWNLMDFLRSEGSTLTTYIFFSSPAGEGNSPGPAYGAAFVLMVVILIVNIALIRLSRRKIGKR
ncbi:MAG: ABC transporter permease subunit [Actinobacteria bacterium]|nr:ABC transporter permease subunit [Actinomycetota bacterium]